MIRNNDDEDFQKFGRVPLEGRMRFWKDTGVHREPNESSYQWSVKMNNHHVVLAEPDGHETVVACVNCKRGLEVEEVTRRLKKYIFGYFYEHSCS